MAFHVDIFFLGILAYVPDKDCAKDISKLAIIVPMTDSLTTHCSPAVDDKPRARHRWFIEFDPAQVKNANCELPPFTRALWNLSDLYDFRRLNFKCSPKPPLTVPAEALNVIPDLGRLAPNYASIPTHFLGWSPGTEIAGQIMINAGRLVPPDEKKKPGWAFPSTLSRPSLYATSLHHRVHLRFDSVTEFEIQALSHPQAQPECLELVGSHDQCVQISICNLCDENPLRWPTINSHRVDHDFRWYYELSATKHNLPSDLYGLDLPVPHPSGQTNAVGQNCLGAKYNAQNFKID